MKHWYTLISLAMLFVCTIGSGRIIKVPQDSSTIQSAINGAVNGDTVLVAEGTHYVNLRLSKKIVLASYFILDNDTSHISKTILDGIAPTQPDTATVITIEANTDTSTMIAGFTITNGAGTKMFLYNSGFYWVGGGINIIAGGATIRHNRIIGNVNEGTESVPWSEGAGISIYPAVGPLSVWVIRDNDIMDNKANGSWGNGGGCYARGTGTIVRNRFLRNTAMSTEITGFSDRGASGGGLQISSFPGTNSSIIVEGNLFFDNRSIYGSAVTTGTYNTSSTTTVKFSNNIIIRNTALATLPGKLPDNGPIHLQRSAIEFVNNTIADNDGYCAIRIGQTPSSSRLLNNIVWNSTIPHQILFASTAPPNPLSANYNCIYGGYAGTGNINADPKFIAGDTLFRLQSTSPCINAGIQSSTVGGVILQAPAFDYAGTVRPRPVGSKPDLGAMEHNAGIALRRVPKDYATIEEAIDACSDKDRVVVSEGTYKVNLWINKKIILASEFYLDGDTSHISKTILDGGTPRHSDSGSVVVLATGTDSTTVVTGFTITKGSGTKLHYGSYLVRYGGGVVMTEYGGGVIRRNIITGNTINVPSGYYGGGGGIVAWQGDLFARPQRAIIEDNIVELNEVIPISSSLSSEVGGIGVWGGYCRITGNIIRNNRADWNNTSTPQPSGGGVLIASENNGNDTMIVIDNIVAGNSARRGGGITVSGNGARATVQGNTIIDNTGGFMGGGLCILYNVANAKVTNNYISRNTSPRGGGIRVATTGSNYFANNIITKNTANSFGGGISINNASGILLVNNTISDNVSPLGHALDYFDTTPSDDLPKLLNCILWGAGASTIAVTSTAGLIPAVSHSLVSGGYNGTAVISADPQFVAGDSLYRFSAVSPAICAGVSKATVGLAGLTAPSNDFLGNTRPRPAGTRCDLGAIEHDSGSVKDPTAVKELADATVPSVFVLEQNYPNPFNPSTIIRYALPTSATVKLTIYDMLGREIETLVDEEQQAGWKEAEWNAAGISSGIYFYRIQSGTFIETRKMMLMK